MQTIEPDPQTYQIIGAAMEVHRELGCGFSEPVYYEPFEIEMQARQIRFERDVELPIIYKGRRMRKTYRVDYICFGAVVVEIKALSIIGAMEEAQLINYMRAAEQERGLLINFGTRSLQYKRRVWQYGVDLRQVPRPESATSTDLTPQRHRPQTGES
jgi:GxxExxY protein